MTPEDAKLLRRLLQTHEQCSPQECAYAEAAARIEALAAENEWLRAGLTFAISRIPTAARALVDRQAEDEGLWFVAESAPEAYLQAALRELHRAIEGETK